MCIRFFWHPLYFSSLTQLFIQHISKGHLKDNENYMFRLSFLSHPQVVTLGYFNIQLLVQRPGYGLEVLGFDPRQGKRFCLQNVQSGFGTYAAFCSVGTGPSFPGCKTAGA